MKEKDILKEVIEKNLDADLMKTVFKAMNQIQKSLAVINFYGLSAATLFILLLFTHDEVLNILEQGVTEGKEMPMDIFFNSITNAMAAVGLPVDKDKVEAILSFVNNNHEFIREEFHKKCQEYTASPKGSGFHLTNCGNNSETAFTALVDSLEKQVLELKKEKEGKTNEN